MQKRFDKRGQNLTLGTIILIVLGIAVLIFLIYGFSVGWGNLFERITLLGGGDSNIDTVQTSCAIACQQNNDFGWCNQAKGAKTGDDIRDEELQDYTCEQLFTEGDLGIDDCPSITCQGSEIGPPAP